MHDKSRDTDVSDAGALIDVGSDMEVSIRDESNSRSIINLVSGVFRSAVESIPDRYFDLSTEELRDLVDPSESEDRLRLAFWTEYDSAQKQDRPMRVSRVYSRICSKQNFYTRILPNKEKLAWILTPPPDYSLVLEEALLIGAERMKEILTAPLYDKKGNFDSKVANAIISLMKSIESRVKGPVPHRIESKSLNLNVNKEEGKEDAKKPEEPQTIEELEARLAELNKKHQPQLPPPPVQPQIIPAETPEKTIEPVRLCTTSQRTDQSS